MNQGRLLDPYLPLVEKIQDAQTDARKSMQAAEVGQSGWRELAPALRQRIIVPLRHTRTRISDELKLQERTARDLSERLEGEINRLKHLPSEIGWHPLILGLRLILWIGNRLLDLVEFILRYWRLLVLIAVTLGLLAALVVILPILFNFLSQVLKTLLELNPFTR